MPTHDPNSVDEYLAGVSSDEARKSLSELREVILAAAPELEEGMSYGMPTYKCRGFVASFAAYKNHCSFFPGHTAAEFAEELKGFKTFKGTIHFPHSQPLPAALVTAIVQARVAENKATQQVPG